MGTLPFRLALIFLITKHSRKSAISASPAIPNLPQNPSHRIPSPVTFLHGNHPRMNKTIISREKLMDAIFEVQNEFIADKPAQEVFDDMLSILLRVTGSEYGFIGQILNDGEQDYLKAHAITNISWNDATRKFYEENAPTGLEFKNLNTLFGRVITDKKPLISNNPYTDERRGGLPEGHPYMGSFCGMPFFHEGKMLGMTGIANRPGGYTEQIVEELQPLLNACGNLIVGYGIVAQRNKTQSILEETIDRLTRQNARLSEFTYMVSHDVRKHIANMQMLSDVISTGSREEQDNASPMLWKSIDQLAGTINFIAEIVDIEALGVKQTHEIELCDFVSAIVETFRISAADMTFKVDIPVDLVIRTERGYLNSIVENLVSNAISYRSPENPCLHIKGDQVDDWVELTFQDNGKGIDLGKHGSSLFKMFATFHGNKDAKGLGLFMVKKLVDSLKGQITVHSELNAGTTFNIRLPRHA